LTRAELIPVAIDLHLLATSAVVRQSLSEAELAMLARIDLVPPDVILQQQLITPPLLVATVAAFAALVEALPAGDPAAVAALRVWSALTTGSRAMYAGQASSDGYSRRRADAALAFISDAPAAPPVAADVGPSARLLSAARRALDALSCPGVNEAYLTAASQLVYNVVTLQMVALREFLSGDVHLTQESAAAGGANDDVDEDGLYPSLAHRAALAEMPGLLMALMGGRVKRMRPLPRAVLLRVLAQSPAAANATASDRLYALGGLRLPGLAEPVRTLELLDQQAAIALRAVLLPARRDADGAWVGDLARQQREDEARGAALGGGGGGSHNGGGGAGGGGGGRGGGGGSEGGDDGGSGGSGGGGGASTHAADAFDLAQAVGIAMLSCTMSVPADADDPIGAAFRQAGCSVALSGQNPEAPIRCAAALIAQHARLDHGLTCRVVSEALDAPLPMTMVRSYCVKASLDLFARLEQSPPASAAESARVAALGIALAQRALCVTDFSGAVQPSAPTYNIGDTAERLRVKEMSWKGQRVARRIAAWAHASPGAAALLPPEFRTHAATTFAVVARRAISSFGVRKCLDGESVRWALTDREIADLKKAAASSADESETWRACDERLSRAVDDDDAALPPAQPRPPLLDLPVLRAHIQPDASLDMHSCLVRLMDLPQLALDLTRASTALIGARCNPAARVGARKMQAVNDARARSEAACALVERLVLKMGNYDVVRASFYLGLKPCSIEPRLMSRLAGVSLAMLAPAAPLLERALSADGGGGGSSGGASGERGRRFRPLIDLVATGPRAPAAMARLVRAVRTLGSIDDAVALAHAAAPRSTSAQQLRRHCAYVQCPRRAPAGPEEASAKKMRCAGCLSAYYCGAECQREAYAAGHKWVCSILRDEKSRGARRGRRPAAREISSVAALLLLG